jgi:hypothetical protein
MRLRSLKDLVSEIILRANPRHEEPVRRPCDLSKSLTEERDVLVSPDASKVSDENSLSRNPNTSSNLGPGRKRPNHGPIVTMRNDKSAMLFKLRIRLQQESLRLL